MNDLFPTPDTHDPGGKSKLRMLPGHRGSAQFSSCGRYRHVLARQWDDENYSPYIMFIGLNPSVATAHSDDPTIRKELAIARREGFHAYIKCNICDYRATNPRALLRPDILPRSDKNLDTIKAYANRAARIVVCWGAVHPTLQGFGLSTSRALKDYQLWCLGITQDGSPCHPLYLKADAPLKLWDPHFAGIVL